MDKKRIARFEQGVVRTWENAKLKATKVVVGLTLTGVLVAVTVLILKAIASVYGEQVAGRIAGKILQALQFLAGRPVGGVLAFVAIAFVVGLLFIVWDAREKPIHVPAPAVDVAPAIPVITEADWRAINDLRAFWAKKGQDAVDSVLIVMSRFRNDAIPVNRWLHLLDAPVNTLVKARDGVTGALMDTSIEAKLAIIERIHQLYRQYMLVVRWMHHCQTTDIGFDNVKVEYETWRGLHDAMSEELGRMEEFAGLKDLHASVDWLRADNERFGWDDETTPALGDRLRLCSDIEKQFLALFCMQAPSYNEKRTPSSEMLSRDVYQAGQGLVRDKVLAHRQVLDGEMTLALFVFPTDKAKALERFVLSYRPVNDTVRQELRLRLDRVWGVNSNGSGA